MKKLVLNEVESKELLENGSIEIERNGFPITVELVESSSILSHYRIAVVNPFEKIVIKK